MIDKLISGNGGLQASSIKPVQSMNSGVDVGKQFGEMLSNAINNLGAEQKHVDQLSQIFATGQMQNVEQMLLTSEKASLNLELTVQLRNKVIEAYQEIMRTQI